MLGLVKFLFLIMISLSISFSSHAENRKYNIGKIATKIEIAGWVAGGSRVGRLQVAYSTYPGHDDLPGIDLNAVFRCVLLSDVLWNCRIWFCRCLFRVGCFCLCVLLYVVCYG